MVAQLSSKYKLSQKAWSMLHIYALHTINFKVDFNSGGFFTCKS